MDQELKQIQAEVGEWSRRNFPNNQPYHPLLGAIEEVEEYFESDSVEDRLDAIADATIYLCDYCERSGLEMSVGQPDPTAMGKLIHYHLKGEQGIRYNEVEITALKQRSLSGFLGVLRDRADGYKANLAEITRATWDKVRKRDWVANPINAAKVAGLV